MASRNPRQRTTSNFYFEIDGVVQAGNFFSVNGGAPYRDTVDHRISTELFSYDNLGGKIKYDEFTVVCGINIGRGIIGLVNDFWAAVPRYFNATVIEVNDKLEEMRRTEILNALLSKATIKGGNAGTSEAAKLEFSFKADRVEFSEGNGSRMTAPVGVKTIANAGSFEVDFTRIAPDAARVVRSFSDITSTMELVEDATGADMVTSHVPGNLKAPEVTFKFGPDAYTALDEYMKEMIMEGRVSQAGWTDITINYKSLDYSTDIVTVDMKGCVPKKYHGHALDTTKPAAGEKDVAFTCTHLEIIPHDAAMDA